MRKNKKPELLAPAGSLEVLKAAVFYGADAVYVGAPEFGLRAKAKNFPLEELQEGIDFAHEHGVKVYLTVNILAHNDDIDKAGEFFLKIKDIRPDAFIISDPGLFGLSREICPDIPIHISTQANNTNYATFRFWHSLGADRVVTARELSLAEIARIRREIPEDMGIESFVHGSMCISYSGRCLLSNFLTGRDANRGECTHPCRWKYAVVEETRPREYMPVEEDERGTYIFNSRDLCMIEHIPELVEAGIDSFKIEGRMKTALYVATVVRAYRKAIDDHFADMDAMDAANVTEKAGELQGTGKFAVNLPWYLEQVGRCTNRQFTTGFFFHKPAAEDHIYDSSTYVQEYVYLGIIHEAESRGEDILISFFQRNKFCVGDVIEIMGSGREDIRGTVLEMYDEDMEKIEACPHPLKKIYALIRTGGETVTKGMVMRMEKDQDRSPEGNN